ncbi:MAG: hypothetical protein QUS33_07805 [Dehalococcoidia bacterium]|nr:hypothetical protein [Dehalococcoidia bacterium]
MRTTGGKSQTTRRSVRWHVKKHDDILIERWALACSREHGNCRDCEFIENCQDLADRLIGCMGVPLTGQYRQSGCRPVERRVAKPQAVPGAVDTLADTLRARVGALR